MLPRGTQRYIAYLTHLAHTAQLGIKGLLVLLFGLFGVSLGMAQTDIAAKAPWQARPAAAWSTVRHSPRQQPSFVARQPAVRQIAQNPMVSQPDNGTWPVEVIPKGEISEEMISEEELGFSMSESGGACDTGDCGSEPCGMSSQNGCQTYWTPFRNRLYSRSEYLLWWTKSADVGTLVTTSPTPTNPTQSDRNTAGVLGRSDTEILFPIDGLNGTSRSGHRNTLGYWLHPCGQTAVEATYFRLGTKHSQYLENSSGDTILARPFFNIDSGAADSELIAFPNWREGEIDIQANTDLRGVEILLRRVILDRCTSKLDFLLGWRHNRLRDDLTFLESLQSIDSASGADEGTMIDILDRFESRNEFNGVEFGLTSRSSYFRWGLELEAKLALGRTTSRVEIDGSTSTLAVGSSTPSISQNGLLAQSTNMGIYEMSSFTAIPELSAMLTFDLSSRTKFVFGYTFMYWSKVARPGDQIDFDLDLTQSSSSRKPEFDFHTTDFWAQGMHFGLDHRF